MKLRPGSKGLKYSSSKCFLNRDCKHFVLWHTTAHAVSTASSVGHPGPKGLTRDVFFYTIKQIITRTNQVI